MGEPLHDIDKLFYDNIEGHSEYPARKVWDKIEAGLDKDTAVAYKKKYKLVKRAAVILLILFLGVLVYDVVGKRGSKENVAGVNQNSGQQGKIAKQQNDAVSDGRQKNNNPSSGTVANNDSPLQNQADNSIFNRGTGDNDDQSYQPVEKNVARETSKEKASNPAGIFKKESSPGKVDLARAKKPLPGQPGFEVILPGQVKNKKVNDLSRSSVIVKSTDTIQSNAVEPIARSFQLLSTGTWKKDLVVAWDPSLNIPEAGSVSILSRLGYPVIKKQSNPLFRNYGLSVTAYFSPNAAWNSIEDDKPYRPGGGASVDHDDIRENERNSFSYSTGIKLGFGLSKRITLQTGINYINSSTAVRPKDIYAEPDNYGNISYRFDCSSGYTYISPHTGTTPAPGDKIRVTYNRNTLSYLGIPLAVEYRMSFGKFGLAASAGGQANILLQGKTTAVLGKGTSEETSVSTNTEGLKSTYFSAIAGVTGEWLISNKLSLIAGPSGQFGLSSINSGASVRTRPNYLGLAAGLKLKL